ncbi:cyclic nucleotide-binding domain-containing protein, partial [Acidobacteria bacterium AH-259-O06]|nr:cyclic nucleotide-binding domain-containing protein [Acidobacteria bacterium AH-259-O06]
MSGQAGLLSKRELENSLLLRGVELEAVIGLLQDCPVRELKRGEVLIQAGQPNQFLYLLLSGRLRIHLKLKLDPIIVLEPGEVVGELSLIDGQLTSAYVVAHEDCRLLTLHEKTMWSLVEDSHAVARNLLFILSRRLRHGNAAIEASLLDKVSEKELEEFEPREVQESKGRLKEEIKTETIELYKTATAYVLESIRGAQEGKRLDIERGEQLLKRMIDSMVNSSALLLLATDREQEFALGTHSVNVSILSLRIAQTLKYNLQKQRRLGLAALLHEIGVGWLPSRLRNQRGQVSPEVRQRPVYGAEILRKLCPQYDWLAQTVGQVYERENGSGFPRGLKGGEIREEAKILGIADVFEACIHDRPYRKAVTGYQLLEELTRGGTRSFSDHIVKALVRSFSLYPYNEYVILNTDEVGQVVEVNPENLLRPVVKILYDSQGESLDEPREIDLAQNPSHSITKAITYHTLPPVR